MANTAATSLSSAGLQAESLKPPSDEALLKGNGPCTLFAIQVAIDAGMSNLTYANLGPTPSHRAAWKTNGRSTIVIDSSARKALLFKQEEESEKHFRDMTWRLHEDKLSHQKEGFPARIFEPFPPGPDAWKSALQMSLVQQLYKTEMVIMFRRVVTLDNGWHQNGYWGRIEWDFKEQTLKWSTKYREQKVVFVPRSPGWTKVHSPAHDKRILGALMEWIQSEECRRKQYSPQLKAIQREVWQAAVKHWGVAKLEKSTMMGPVPGKGGGGG